MTHTMTALFARLAALVVVVTAVTAVPAAAADDSFRATQPPPAAAKVMVVPPVQTARVGGLDVVLVEDHSLPVVSVRFVFPYGAASDDAAHAGRASLCVRTLNEGPARLTKVAYEEALADLAATIETGAGVEQSAVSLRALKEVWRPTLDLAVEVLAKPGLRADDLERQRARTLAQLAQQRGSAAGIAARLQGRVLWGDTHPLGQLTTDDTLKAITVDDCRAVARGLAPDGARVIVAGDVSLTEVQTALREAFQAQGFTGRALRSPPLPPARTAGAPTVVFVDVKGAEQSVITLVGDGPARQAADYDATNVMMTIFGGGFSSRLNMNLREKHGYTYGARAGQLFTRSRGAFVAQASVRSDATGPALREIDAELRAMRTGVVNDDEFARERDGALAALPALFATSSSTAEAWSSVFFYGLPKDTLVKAPAKLQRLQKADVEKAAKLRLPHALRVLVVGDASKVKAELDALATAGTFGKAGAVLVVDADGKPLPPH